MNSSYQDVKHRELLEGQRAEVLTTGLVVGTREWARSLGGGRPRSHPCWTRHGFSHFACTPDMPECHPKK